MKKQWVRIKLYARIEKIKIVKFFDDLHKKHGKCSVEC